MAYQSGGTGRGNRLGAYWRDHPEGVEQGADREREALGNARPSRYGLSSPTNFPPARSPRSPGGFHGSDDPSCYEHPPNLRAQDGRRGEGGMDREEWERLYRIATGQKEPQFRDALREGPWAASVLNRRGFLLCLAECAVYAACFWYLLDPMTVLTARLGVWSAPAAAAGISLAGTLACMVLGLLFRERRMVTTAWGWMAAAAFLLFCLLQILLWGEAQAQWTAVRFFGFFLLGPVTANGLMAYGCLYLHWRRAHPRPKQVSEEEDEEEEGDETEEEPNRRPVRREPDRGGWNRSGMDRGGWNRSGMDRDGWNRSGMDRDGWNRSGMDRDGWNRSGMDRDGWNRSGMDRDGWNRSALDRDGWNRNLAVRDRDAWDRRPSEGDRRRWRQTEADRDGRRRAESVRNKWK